MNARVLLAVVLVATAASVAVTGTQIPGPELAGKVVGGDTAGADIQAFVPLESEAALEDGVLTLSSAVRVPVGLEVRLEPRPAGPSPSVSRRLVRLTGLTLGDGLRTLTAGGVPSTPAGGIDIQWDAGIVDVSTVHGTSSFLDRRLGTFAVSHSSLEGAVRVLLHELDGNYHPEKPEGFALVGGDWGPNSPMWAKRDQFAAESVSVSLRDSTVREILNALCIAKGDASWVVRHRAEGGVERPEIVLASMDGFRVHLPVPAIK